MARPHEVVPAIVCVDDEDIVLQGLRAQLRQEFGDAVRVELAADAAEALDLIDELIEEGTSIPAVISDHIMPGMHGDVLLAEVHRRLPSTRTILLTGQAGLDALSRAINEAGLYRYFAKPWQRDDLVLTVREAIRSFEAEATLRRQRE